MYLADLNVGDIYECLLEHNDDVVIGHVPDGLEKPATTTNIVG